MFNQGGGENSYSLSLGSAKYPKPFSPLLGMVNLPAQRHTSLEGVCIHPTPTSAFKPRLARVRSAIVQTLIWKLVRNANQSANGDQQLATVLVQKWLVNALGARLGSYFYELAFPETPSPVTLSYPNTTTRRDGTQNQPKGGERPNTSRFPPSPPYHSISLFTREDENGTNHTRY
jgi:hypothetical protein